MAGCGTMGAFVFSVLYCAHKYVDVWLYVRTCMLCVYGGVWVCMWVWVWVSCMCVLCVCMVVWVCASCMCVCVCVCVCVGVCVCVPSVCMCVRICVPMLVSTVCILPWPGVLSFCSAAVNTLLLPQCLCSARYMLCKALYAYRAPSAVPTVHVACNQ